MISYHQFSIRSLPILLCSFVVNSPINVEDNFVCRVICWIYRPLLLSDFVEAGLKENRLNIMKDYDYQMISDLFFVY